MKFVSSSHIDRITRAIGQLFGRLTILNYAGKDHRGYALVRCRCSCGEIKIAQFYKVINELLRSCGCLRKESARLTGSKLKRLVKPGDKYGLVIVLSQHGVKRKRTHFSQKVYLWECLCSCGKIRIIPQNEFSRVEKAAFCRCNVTRISPGDKFSRLTVMMAFGKAGYETLWKCKCTCGRESIVRGGLLSFGSVRSCGCLQREKASQFKMPNDVKVFANRIRVRVRGALTSRGLVKNGKTFELLGYSPQDLYSRLKQFVDNPCVVCRSQDITVKNSNIDHEIPLLSAVSMQDIVVLNRLSNLRLICAPCNNKKAAQDHLHSPSNKILENGGVG